MSSVFFSQFSSRHLLKTRQTIKITQVSQPLTTPDYMLNVCVCSWSLAFVACRLIYHSHILFKADALIAVLSRTERFVKNNISQNNVVWKSATMLLLSFYEIIPSDHSDVWMIRSDRNKLFFFLTAVDVNFDISMIYARKLKCSWEKVRR